MNKLDLKNAEFQKYFGVNDKFQDRFVTMASRKYSLDVIKFDKWLHEAKGYRERKHGSMVDFISKEFGDEAVKFIQRII